MQVNVNTNGIKKLDRQIKNINKKAMRAGAKVVLDAVKGNVPIDSGALRQSLSTKVDSLKGEVIAYAVVGPRSRYTKAVGGQVKKPSRYAHFIESGKFARPFLMPTFQANKTAFLKTVSDVTANEIKKAING